MGQPLPRAVLPVNHASRRARTLSIERKPSAVGRIITEAPILTITGMMVFDVPDTATYLEGFPEVERHDRLRRIMELGTQITGVMTTSSTLVIMNAAARIAVARVNRLAVERPVMNPDMPPPPMPSAPPSLFCSKTTPTSEIAISTWMTNSRMNMGQRVFDVI